MMKLSRIADGGAPQHINFPWKKATKLNGKNEGPIQVPIENSADLRYSSINVMCCSDYERYLVHNRYHSQKGYHKRGVTSERMYRT
uniref:Uncharacterized protein n=1 Tax=Romanomermis culicivorax TaxID=13658 RepID=A0A915JCM9_ROMCU